MWELRPLEKHIEWLLKNRLKANGEKLWSRYVATRDEMVSEVLPWIASKEPDLTDHGTRHIADVIDNAAMLLGYKLEFGAKPSVSKDHDLKPQEMLVLLTGLVIHDVGNIFGRKRHNQKIPMVWKKLTSWPLWHDNERNLFIDVGRAHSGKTATGSEDTLQELQVSPRYFEKESVRSAEIAAVIRFADELAEGEQRTSKFLLANSLIPPKSKMYHQYAEITRVSIDRPSGRVALNYFINIDNPKYPTELKKLRAHLRALLNMVSARAAKMNFERRFARHYAVALAPFKETSISITLQQEGVPTHEQKPAIILNELIISQGSCEKIEHHSPDFNIEKILDSCLGGKRA